MGAKVKYRPDEIVDKQKACFVVKIFANMYEVEYFRDFSSHSIGVIFYIVVDQRWLTSQT